MIKNYKLFLKFSTCKTYVPTPDPHTYTVCVCALYTDTCAHITRTLIWKPRYGRTPSLLFIYLYNSSQICINTNDFDCLLALRRPITPVLSTKGPLHTFFPYHIRLLLNKEKRMNLCRKEFDSNKLCLKQKGKEWRFHFSFGNNVWKALYYALDQQLDEKLNNVSQIGFTVD